MEFKKGDIVVFKDKQISSKRFIIHSIQGDSDKLGKHLTILEYDPPNELMTSTWECYMRLDVVVRNDNKPDSSFESIKVTKILEIKNVQRLSNVYFYSVTKTNILNDSIIFPQVDFDSMYELEKIYNRRKKLIKIYGRIKTP